MVAAFKSLREFCKNLGIQPFAENLDYDEFSPNYLSTMSVNELQQVCIFLYLTIYNICL